MREFEKVLSDFQKFLDHPEDLTRKKISSIKILGDVFEALVGAIFVDNRMNYDKTRDIIMNLIKPFLKHFTDLENLRNSSSYKFHKYL